MEMLLKSVNVYEKLIEMLVKSMNVYMMKKKRRQYTKLLRDDKGVLSSS